MVQQGDFTVELVEAVTKTPFKEHYHNAKVYVEVEPEAEYYISVRKTGTSRECVSRMILVVDDQELNYGRNYEPKYLSKEPNYSGLRSVSGGIKTHTALKFEKPRISQAGSATSNPSQLMGKVQVRVHEGIYKGIKDGHHQMESKTISSDISDSLAKGSKGKKVLRSTKGNEAVSKEASKRHRSYKRGKLIDTITLHYCAAVGLIQAGVLAKPPDIYEHHRMIEKFANTRRSRAAATSQSETVDISAADDVSGDAKPSLKREPGAQSETVDLTAADDSPGDVKPSLKRKHGED